MAMQQLFAFEAPPPPAEITQVAEAAQAYVVGPPSLVAATRDEILRDLRAKAGCISTVEESGPTVETFSTGNADLDQRLPRGGLRVDSITEWVGQNHASVAGALSLVTAAVRLARHSGPLIVVARDGEFYPPAAVAMGIPVARIIWVRPSCHADAVWSIDQSLRCDAVAAVWSPVGAQLDDRDARRFQLASETGHTPGLFVRPIATRGRPSFADTRFHVRLAKRGQGSKRGQASLMQTEGNESSPVLRVTVDRCRGGTGGDSLAVQIDDRGRLVTLSTEPIVSPTKTQHHETAAVRLASELAHPTTSTGRSARRA